LGLVSFFFFEVLRFLVTDGRPFDVEDDAEVVGLLLFQEFPQGAEEAVDGARREAFGV